MGAINALQQRVEVLTSELPLEGLGNGFVVTGEAKQALTDANLRARDGQRTPLRRLTRLEYAYTIQDLLGLDEA